MSEENQVFTEKRSAMLQRTAEYLAVTRRVRNQKVTLVIGRIIAWGLLVGVAALTKSWLLGIPLALIALCSHFISVEPEEVEPARKAFLLGILRNYLKPDIKMEDLESKRSRIMRSDIPDLDKETKLMEIIDGALLNNQNELTFGSNIREAYIRISGDSFENNLVLFLSRIKG